MTYIELLKKHREILNSVISCRLNLALQIISELKAQVNSSDIQNRYEVVSHTYQSMLKYSFALAPDPQRFVIHNHIQRTLIEIADDIKHLWIQSHHHSEESKYRAYILPLNSMSESSINQLIVELSITGSDQEQKDTGAGLHENLPHKTAKRLFYSFWLTNTFKDAEKDLLMRLIQNRKITWSLRSLWISALTLSLMRHFDSQKVFVLFDISQSDEPEIRQRALTGLFLCLLLYKRRIPLYKKITDRLLSIPDTPVIRERFLAILIQYIRASETEMITKKIQEEIVPEVMKIRSELEDKLNLEDLMSKANFEEKNPEWENFFKDAPDVYQKLEQFSQLQGEGSDVFMGAFAMLKQFDFFRDMSNWFIPFEKGNQEMQKILEPLKKEMDVSAFVDGLEKSSVLCNSDKYSFCLNVKHMPSEQRNMMLELFNMEMKAMNEMSDDTFKLNSELKNKVVNTQYLQDVYRFFKLYPFRKEFEDVFTIEIDLLDMDVLSLFLKDDKIIKNLAEFYFAKDYYAEALKLFIWLNQKKKSYELLEKSGFCFQKLNNFDKAIQMYKQAELFDRNKIWLYKKLGYCYRKINNSAKAIEYYEQILKSEPNDLNNLAYLGQLNIDIGNFEDALKYYYRVEYEKPDNPKVFRPIGWCSFVLGKYDVAVKYFNKILKGKPGKSDYLNLGHSYWAAGKMDKALEAYRNGIRISGNDISWFRDAFQIDSEYLKKTGIEKLDIALMIDYVLL